MATKRELIQAIAERYHSAPRSEKKIILDEFTQVPGYHWKHAIRALRKTAVIGTAPAPRSRCIALRYEKKEAAAEKPEQYRLFDTPEYRYRVFVTNMTGGIALLTWFHRCRRYPK